MAIKQFQFRHNILQLKRGTAAEWAAEDQVLSDGELGVETDTKIMKLGDGRSLYSALASFIGEGGSGASAFTDLTDAPAAFAAPGSSVCVAPSGEALSYRSSLDVFRDPAIVVGRWFQASSEVTESMDMDGWDRTVFAVPIALPDPAGQGMEVGIAVTAPPDAAIDVLMAIYADDGGLPGSRVSLSAAFTIEPASVAAYGSITPPSEAGIYWLVFVMNTPPGTLPELQGVIGSTMSDNRRVLGQQTDPAGYGYICVQSGSTANWPTPLGSTIPSLLLTASTGAGDPECPLMFYRYVAA